MRLREKTWINRVFLNPAERLTLSPSENPARFFFLLFFLMMSYFVNGQDNFLFERMNIEDGLSNNSINSILQTNDGFLWIATKDGLNRYDGQGFKVFKYSSEDPASLPENYVMSLLESKNGTLWIGTWGGGLCRYDPLNECFVQVRSVTGKDDYIQSLFEDRENNIWFGTTEGGIFKFTPQNGKFACYSHTRGVNSSFPSNNITYITEDNSGKLWVATWDAGLVQFNPGNGSYKHFSHDPLDSNSISSNWLWDIYIESDSTLLVSTLAGINRYHIFTGEFSRFTDPNPEYSKILSTSIRQIIRDRQGRLWIGSYDYFGLFMFEKDGEGNSETYHFVSEDDNPSSLTVDRIRYIYEDKKGNIWIGTETGLNKLPVHQPFQQFRHLPMRQNSLGGRVVSSIFQDTDNILWIGYGGGGFDKISQEENTIRHFVFYPGNRNELSDNDVTSIYKSKDGILWICTMNGGLNRFDPVTEKFKIFRPEPGNPLSISSYWVHQVIETSRNIFLVGTNDGLDTFDPKSGTFHFFEPELPVGEKPLPHTISVNALFEDSRQNIWIGTWLDGVYCYSFSQKHLVQYLHRENDPQSISSNKITCIFEDSGGTIWLGTHSGGMDRFDPNTGMFITFNLQNGLPNDVVFGIQEDLKGNLWISTMKGLAKFNPETKKIRVYDQLDGLVDNQFNWRASYKNKSGYMYFGGINGFVSFHPDSIQVDTIPPQVAITSFKVFERKAAIQQFLPAVKEIRLKHDQNFFSIEFTALDMAPSKKHKYAYMLTGIDPDWVYPGTRSVAYYTALRNGSFNFLVKACNADDVWSEPVKLSIQILPAWWNTWWVKLMGLAAIFSIGIVVTRIRLWQLLEIERIRLTIASDLHDEMGSNLSSISVDSQQLMKYNKNDKQSYELASDIYKTTNETIDSIRDIIWFINPKNDGGENIVFKMKEKAVTLLAGLKWTFKVSDDLRLDTIRLEVRRNIFLIYKETLTNVVRHSNAKKCDIELRKEKDSLIMSICDDGVGFNIPHTKTHGGLENIYHRAKKIHARIELKSEKEHGTCLYLELPI